MLGKPYRDVFAERRAGRYPPPPVAPPPVAPPPAAPATTPLAVVGALACVGLTIAFGGILLIVPTPAVPPAGGVAIVGDPLSYGFGPRKTLLVFNLTAFANTTVGDERGLEGIHDVHPYLERLATISMYKDGTVHDGLVDVPVAIDQKGGDRPQLNLGFELRDKADPSEDAKYALLESTDETYEDWSLRGCYFDPSCTRDLAPTVLDVTPQMRGESVEVLFWDATRGYTYEGVYNLMVKLKRSFYQDEVPWSSKGKKSDAPCDDSFRDLGLVFESERPRLERSVYTDFEKEVQADAKYPKASYWEQVKAECPAETYRLAADYFTVPNLQNASAVPLDLHSFAQMYVAAQLMMQVDFGFEGAQQFYFKNPGSLVLSTGPPYDFDGPWDLCMDADAASADVVTCHGSLWGQPLWAALGTNAAFLDTLRRTSVDLLHADHAAIDRLYAERESAARAGYFARHEARWPTEGRTPTLLAHMMAGARSLSGAARSTVLEELQYQRGLYARRFAALNATLPTVDRFAVRVSFTAYLGLAVRYFWWYLHHAHVPRCAPRCW